MSERRCALFVVGEFQLEVIERVVTRVERVGGTIAGVALKEPVAVVVRTPQSSWRVELERVTSLSDD